MLHAVFKSLKEEQPTSSRQATIMIINTSPLPGSHQALHETLEENRTSYPYVRVEDNPYLQTMFDLGKKWKQTQAVIRPASNQLLDVISTLMVAYTSIPLSAYYMFLEDDFVACPGALQEIHIAVRTANKRFAELCTSHKTVGAEHNGLKGWRGIRFTHGMAGILVPAAAIPSIAFYMLKTSERIPVDHALVEWILGAGEAPWQSDVCPYFIVRQNWFVHKGGQLSTFRGRVHPTYLSCGDNMTSESIFRKGEAFDGNECPKDVMFPCMATIRRRRQATKLEG